MCQYYELMILYFKYFKSGEYSGDHGSYWENNGIFVIS